MKKSYSIFCTSCIFREIREIRLISDSDTPETLNPLTFKNLTPIVSPLKRFVKHLNHITINHLHTVSFKSKFLRLPNASNVFTPPSKSLSRFIGRVASLIDWQGGCKFIYNNQTK